MKGWTQTTEDKDTLKFSCTEPSNSRIVEIYMYLHHPKVTLSLTLTADSYQIFQNYFEYHAEFGFANPDGLFMTDMGYHCTLTFDEVLEKDKLDRFLSEVLRFDPSIIEIVSSIKKGLQSDERYGISQDISQELAHGHFGFVLESAKHLYMVGSRDVLLKLAKQCFKLSYFKEGLASLECLDETDKVGHFEAAHLILLEKNMSEKSFDRLGLALKHLFKCGDDPVVQKIRDRVFAYVTGEPETNDIVPTITGVRINDANVLVKILSDIRQLNEKKKALLATEHSLKELVQKGANS
jgi:hypothetical protein